MNIAQISSKKNRALLSELVRTDFKLRYQGSVLGYAWSLLRPLLIFLILYVVFVRVIPLGKDVPHYPVYLLLGIVIWNFFYEMTVQSLGSIVGRGDLIRKIRIPRWIIVFSSSLSALINLLLNMVVVVILMAFNHVDLLSTTIWLPIIYPMTRVGDLQLQKLMLLNPMAQALQDARYATISHDATVVTIGRAFNNGAYRFIPFAIVIAVLVGGVAYFKKQSKDFAENI
jgi:ABC-2 type transport system permease protein